MLVKFIFSFAVSMVFWQTLVSQNTQTTSNLNIENSTIPLKIIAHTDSSIFVLGKKANLNGEWDFYISKHTVNSNKEEFNVCLNLIKVFKGGINPNSDNFEFMQCKNHIALLFTAVNQENKILLGKTIGYEGTVSEAFVVDRTDYTNENLEKCEYKFFSTTKKDILVHINRIYKSGFTRDKCMLLNSYCNKVWEYELPELNGKTEENIIVDVDNLNRLIYYPWQFLKKANFNMDGQVIFQSVYREVKDTILPLKVGNLSYSMKFRKDSIKLFIVNPTKNEITRKALYYPFVSMPVIKSITSSQLLMYGMVDIDDENYHLIGKKAMYYKRFDLKSESVLLDTLVVLDNKLQQKLMHTYAPGSRHPTSKYFKLLSENIVNGSLINIYEHGNNGQFLEIFAVSFNIADNKPEWLCLLPRKINFYYPHLYDLVIRNYFGNTSISFFEHRKNALKTNENYEFGRYKLLRKPHDKRFVSYVVSSSGEVVKKTQENVDDNFMFPWLGKSNEIDRNHFFVKKDFLPVEYLYRAQ